MEINGVSYYRHRKTTSSDRFLGVFSLTTASDADISGDELTEADLFWTGGGGGGLTDSSGLNHSSTSPDSRRDLAFRLPENSGILAALPDDCGNRLPTLTATRAIPKPPHRVVTGGESVHSAPCRKFQHSAPVNVPSMMRKPKRFGQLGGFPEERENEEDEEMLPPHEIVAMKLKSTSSVLEGVGRTLKGRDLRQVRNAVWRQTGFLD